MNRCRTLTHGTCLALLCLAGLAIEHPVHAQSSEAAQQYDVELVVFSLNKPTGSAEDWLFEETLGPLGESPASDQPASAAANIAFQTFPTLDPSLLRMGTTVASLGRSSAYKVIAHFGWRQPGKGTDTAIPVAINSLLPEGTPIFGTVTLIRTRFVHLKVNMAYRAPDAKTYVLREQRRMQKTGEKHYLDHPYFGVIALVTPSN